MVNNSRSHQRGQHIAKLEQEIHQLKVKGGETRNRPRRVRSGVPGANPARGPHNPPHYQSSPQGGLVVKYAERWGPVGTGPNNPSTVGNFVFRPGQSGLARLDQLAAMYDLYRLKRANVTYRPSVGTTTNGTVTAGIDYDSIDLPVDVRGLDVLYPRSSGPVYSTGRVEVDCSRAMKAKWHYTINSGGTPYAQALQTAFAYCTGTEAASGPEATYYGVAWCEYEVEFAGPQPSNLTSAQNVVTTANRLEFVTPASAGFPANITTGTGSTAKALGKDLYLPITYTGVLGASQQATREPDDKMQLNIALPSQLFDQSRNFGTLSPNEPLWLRKGQEYLFSLTASSINQPVDDWTSATADLAEVLRFQDFELISTPNSVVGQVGTVVTNFIAAFVGDNFPATLSIPMQGTIVGAGTTVLDVVMSVISLPRSAAALRLGNVGGVTKPQEA